MMSVTMRPWSDADTRVLLFWMERDPQLISDMGGYEDGVVETIARRQQDATHGKALIAAIEWKDQLAAYLTVYPRMGDRGVIHFCLAPALRGHGAEIFKGVVDRLATAGITHLIAPPVTRLTPAAQERVWRRMGFTTKFYGEHYA